MTNEEKIISMLSNIQKDVKAIKAEQDKKELIASIERFARADTPEEQAEIDAFLAYMDAEEERKRARYALLS